MLGVVTGVDLVQKGSDSAMSDHGEGVDLVK